MSAPATTPQPSTAKMKLPLGLVIAVLVMVHMFSDRFQNLVESMKRGLIGTVRQASM